MRAARRSSAHGSFGRGCGNGCAGRTSRSGAGSAEASREAPERHRGMTSAPWRDAPAGRVGRGRALLYVVGHVDGGWEAMVSASRSDEAARAIERGAVEFAPAALRRRFAAAYEPQPAIYWADMLGSACIGWSAFALAGFASGL